MPELNTSTIQDRIANLKAELDDLSVQLACGQCETVIIDPLDDSLRIMEGERPAEPDHQGSLRTLRDLLWQGRWGLAFHLTRALERQGVSEVDFRSSKIRAWAMASRADRRGDDETLRMIEELMDEAPGESLASRLLDWSTLIGLLRGVDPGKVRAIASRFRAPEELPATAKLWHDYVEALARAERPTTRWTPLPEHETATAEIGELVLRSEAEPVRLASTCLMLSIRSAMRHVRVLTTVDGRFVLNAELERATSLKVADNGDVAAAALEVEQAVCELAATRPGGRRVIISPAVPAESSVLKSALTARAADFEPTADLAGGDSAIHEQQSGGPALNGTGPFVSRFTASEGRAVAVSQPTLLRFPLESTLFETSERPRRDEPAPTLADARRGIHETAVATAFRGEGGAATTVHPSAGFPLSFFNPQSAIVAGLLIIAGSVVAGLGSGLMATGMSQAASQMDQESLGVASPDVAGDFPIVD